MKKFNAVVLFLCRLFNYIACLVLVFMMAFIVIYIVLRKVFGYAIFGTFEIVQLSSMTLVACALAYNEYGDGNISIDTLVVSLKPLGQRILKSFALLVSTVMIGYTAEKMTLYIFSKASGGAVTPNLEIPIWIFITILSVSLVLLTICLLFRLIATIVGYEPISADQTGNRTIT